MTTKKVCPVHRVPLVPTVSGEVVCLSCERSGPLEDVQAPRPDPRHYDSSDAYKLALDAYKDAQRARSKPPREYPPETAPEPTPAERERRHEKAIRGRDL